MKEKHGAVSFEIVNANPYPIGRFYIDLGPYEDPAWTSFISLAGATQILGELQQCEVIDGKEAGRLLEAVASVEYKGRKIAEKCPNDIIAGLDMLETFYPTINEDLWRQSVLECLDPNAN